MIAVIAAAVILVSLALLVLFWSCVAHTDIPDLPEAHKDLWFMRDFDE